jgi:pantetheine-phosphate adenylyltransferase
MATIAVFPGTFDPLTLGHANLADKALKLFDEVYLAIGHNTNKQHFFSLEDRLSILKTTFQHDDRFKVTHFTGLTVDFCEQIGASFIVRGLRNTTDFENEKAILEMNHKLNPAVETVLLTTYPLYSAISSTIVREVIRNRGPLEEFVPASAAQAIYAKLG